MASGDEVAALASGHERDSVGVAISGGVCGRRSTRWARCCISCTQACTGGCA
jgi:hypothetical protein